MIDATAAALERSLDLRMKAHEVHASNVANANVPGYKAKKIDFEGRMREALAGVDGPGTRLEREAEAAAKASAVQADVYEDPLAKMSGDGNTVNMETEQTEIAKNTIAYEAALQLLNKRFMMQKSVLTEGR